MGKRAINFTTSELSMIFYLVGMICCGYTLKKCMDFYGQLSLTNPMLAAQFSMMAFLVAIGLFFFFLSMSLPNYMISKYNLNLFIDRITNPDYIGWLRFTRSKMFRPHIVKKGPLGQTKGWANGAAADAINSGDYTVTLQNGNQAIIKSDLLPMNVNLENCVGWQLEQKHFGIFGFKTWERAADRGKLVLKKFFKKKLSNEEDIDE